MSNLLPLTQNNLAENERRIKASTKYVRFNSSLPELLKGESPDWTQLDLINQLIVKYGRVGICALVAQFPNSKCVRAWYPGDKTALWEDQKTKDETGCDWSWKSPLGLPDWMIQPSLDLFKRFISYCPKTTIFQPGNEEGNTEDARRSVWTTAPGTVDPRFQPYALNLCKLVKDQGYLLATMPAETQDVPTFENQMNLIGAQLLYADFTSANYYFTRWKTGDTPETYASRFWTELKRWYRWSRLPIIASEYYPFDCPADMVDLTWQAVRRATPSWAKCAVFYDVR